jgi:hypothetical protein
MNNPPAFPTGTGVTPYNPGMTLRDYFAAKAIQAILTSPSWMENKPSTLAKMSYEIADAMLKARTE